MREASPISATHRIRPPAVAGTFYPDDPARLQAEIDHYLDAASSVGPVPRALIVPHAGYRYSGPVAASGFVLLRPLRPRIERVVLLGPSHHVPFYGLAVSRADVFATPLGTVPLDHEAIASALEWPQVQTLEQAHQYEHSLEVQLPFLQRTLDHFRLVPLAVGEANASEVADVIDALWTDRNTLVVVSSDLSHYHDYWTARAIDSETSNLIEALDWLNIGGKRACGYGGIRGLLKVAQQRHLQVKTVDLRNSGDTSGMTDQVVGYGSYVVHE